MYRERCRYALTVSGERRARCTGLLRGLRGEYHDAISQAKRSNNVCVSCCGYCPQFDAVFGELTGRETLQLFSLLRGLRSEHAAARADMLAHALGFTKHLDKRVEQYSGGNKRKLSTAVALLGHTRLVFVDEPTTGVDPAAKRQVWRAVRGVRRAGRGVVLTSHSMEECEALCSRLTIMVNGQFQCLGTPQHLKTKFSEGFTLTIKMKMDEECRIRARRS
ncbi:phospholipid-transporting ATPase ABCA3-like [Choristoneura fumiferana]|uniref:phospholipid-transporting ATPase ABCA3-like n=1 Tax=Choristoneura fumiferana TaxID=7141 RepID=UPI003D158C64